jgi:hypothetical protein
MKQVIHLPRIVRIAIAACLFFGSLAFAGQAVDDAEARSQGIWRKAIAQTPVPTEGCFQATYPSLTWNKVECVVAANVPFIPRSGRISQTVGDGNDYAAEVSSGQINTTIGTFPTVTGVKKETGQRGANDYSLQINSNTQNTAICSGAGNPAECVVWQQFVYASGLKQAFIQYWLINWNNPCPSGWNSYESDCFTNNGTAVAVPKEPITKLSGLLLSGLANEGGIDTLVFTTGTEAYSTTGSDSVLDLASFWTESEFNVVGDSDGSEANFNSGSSVTVQVVVLNGTTDAPTCAADAGTTAETNNLNLGSCAGTGGASPYIEFSESNPETITTEAATNITASSAYLSGTVNPEGDGGYAYFYYGTDPSMTYYNIGCGADTGCPVTANFKAQSFNFTPTGLASNTTYYFQIAFYDTSNGSYSYGSILSFTTKNPVLTDTAATKITASSAYLSGTVNPEGDGGYAYFYYGTDPSMTYYNIGCGADTGCPVTANFKAQTFNFTPTGLASNTTYYFQIAFYDTSNGSYSYGSILSFTTSP